MRTFLVAEGFPRLKRSDMPHGIIDAAYAVDLVSCIPYEIDITKVLRMLRDATGS